MVVIIKAALTLYLASFAGFMAAKSVKEASDGKRRISPMAFSIVLGSGLLVGLVSIILPIAWPVHFIFLIMLFVLQLANTEGKYRATSWGSLSLLTGLMLIWSMASWQDEIGGIRLWMVVAAAVIVLVMIFIGWLRGLYLEYIAKEENHGSNSNRVGKWLASNGRTAIIVVASAAGIATVVSAIVWAAS